MNNLLCSLLHNHCSVLTSMMRTPKAKIRVLILLIYLKDSFQQWAWLAGLLIRTRLARRTEFPGAQAHSIMWSVYLKRVQFTVGMTMRVRVSRLGGTARQGCGLIWRLSWHRQGQRLRFGFRPIGRAGSFPRASCMAASPLATRFPRTSLWERGRGSSRWKQQSCKLVSRMAFLRFHCILLEQVSTFSPPLRGADATRAWLLGGGHHWSNARCCHTQWSPEENTLQSYLWSHFPHLVIT